MHISSVRAGQQVNAGTQVVTIVSSVPWVIASFRETQMRRALQRTEIAAGLISGSVHAQSFTLSVDDSFMLLALASIVALVAILMMTPIPLPHQLPEADAEPVAAR